MPRSFISSLFGFTCPQCRIGDLFFKPWSMEKAYKMPDRCAHCSLNYVPEPGYWYGAMYLSYMVTAFWILAFALTAVFALHWNIYTTFALIIGLAVISHNFFFRFSRSLWIHLMVSYDKKKAAN